MFAMKRSITEELKEAIFENYLFTYLKKLVTLLLKGLA